MNRFTFRIGILAVVVLLFAGCTTMSGTASYNYFDEELSSTEMASVPAVHRAVLMALEQLDLPLKSEKMDDLVSVVTTKTADGTYYDIITEWRSEDSSEVTITMYDCTDRYKAMGLLQKIRDNLVM